MRELEIKYGVNIPSLKVFFTYFRTRLETVFGDYNTLFRSWFIIFLLTIMVFVYVMITRVKFNNSLAGMPVTVSYRGPKR
jgi:hypothetical protein